MKSLALVASVVLLCGGSMPGEAADLTSPTVVAIQQRGVLSCAGHNGSNPGFAELDDKGQWKGFDVDLCRAVAVAILGSADKAKFVPLSWAQRWEALDSREIDVLIKTTDATMTRDTELGFQFSVPYMLGAYNFLVHKELGAKTATDLNGGTICTAAGTANVRFLADFLQVHNIKATVLTFDKREEERAAYSSKRCDADLGWGPSLAVMRVTRDDPDAHIILPDVVAVAAEVALTRQGDDRFVNLVDWVIEALLNAEDMGITKENVDEFKAHPTNPAMQRLLGVVPGMGARLGLKDDNWAYMLIKDLGNFGQIWDRNLGKDSPYKLDRGLNSLWKSGGVLVPYVID